jgi:regulator of sigma E protease
LIITTFAPILNLQMEEIFIKGAQLVLSLSILVILHELGHFIPAKVFGVRVEKFYLFFNPWFSLFTFKKGETTYGLGWLPLGGYVKLSGMIDESMDKEQLQKPMEPYEFRAKPAWQRLIIMIGGVTVNVLLGIFIYSMLLYSYGKVYLTAENAQYGVHVGDYLNEIGFEDGDKVLGFNGYPIPADFSYRDVTAEMILNDTISTVDVKRDGKKVPVAIPEDFSQQILAREEKRFFTERIPFVIDTILTNSPASESQLKKNDRLVSINGVETQYFMDFVHEIGKHKDEKVELGVIRDGSLIHVSSGVSSAGKIGVGNKGPNYHFELTKKSYTFMASFPAGVQEAYSTIERYVQQFKLVFTKEGVSQVGGFGTIGNLFPAKWDWQIFWNMTAFLSLILAFMNILPIPALDGGHVLFLLYEMVSGRKPGDKFLEYATLAGMILLLGLLILANGNDVIRWFSK